MEILVVFIIFYVAYCIAGYSGIIDTTEGTIIPLPKGCNSVIKLEAQCFEKEIGGDYKISFKKYFNDDDFLEQMIPSKIFLMEIKKEKCQLIGDGYQKAIQLYDPRTAQVITNDILFTIPANMDGGFRGDTIYLNFSSNQTKGEGDSWEIVCIQSHDRLNRFQGKFFDNMEREIGQVIFEKYTPDFTLDKPEKKEVAKKQEVKAPESEKEFEETSKIPDKEEIEKKAKQDRKKHVADKNANQNSIFPATISYYTFYRLPSGHELDMKNSYTIQIAAKSTLEELELLVKEYADKLGDRMILYKTHQDEHMFKLLIGRYNDLDEAKNYKNLLRGSFPDVGELKSAWVVYSEDLLDK